MTSKTEDDEQEYSADETARRRDAVLKIMVNTPPKPHATRSQVRQKKQKSTVEGRVKAKPSGRRGKPSWADAAPW